jgi:hypothetical protein
VALLAGVQNTSLGLLKKWLITLKKVAARLTTESGAGFFRVIPRRVFRLLLAQFTRLHLEFGDWTDIDAYTDIVNTWNDMLLFVFRLFLDNGADPTSLPLLFSVRATTPNPRTSVTLLKLFYSYCHTPQQGILFKINLLKYVPCRHSPWGICPFGELVHLADKRGGWRFFLTAAQLTEWGISVGDLRQATDRSHYAHAKTYIARFATVPASTVAVAVAVPASTVAVPASTVAVPHTRGRRPRTGDDHVVSV